MSTLFAVLLVLFGVCIAVLSALLVLQGNRGRQWYALPLCYCVLVGIVTALVSHERIDIAAIVFFSIALTFIGWSTVKFQLRRR
jgi:hypothetical protein